MSDVFRCIPKSNNIICFSLFLLTVCNLNCSYCYARKTKTWNKILKKEELVKILNYLGSVQFDFKITLLGGEPTLYPDLKFAVLNLIKMKRCKTIEIFTNGMKYFDFPESDKIFLALSFHKQSKGFNLDRFLTNLEKYRLKFNPVICSPQNLSNKELLFFKDLKIHYQNISENNKALILDCKNNDMDKFLFKNKIVNLDYVVKQNLSFKGLNCDMFNFLIEKNKIIDECNGKEYGFGEKLQITRKCKKENCFKNGDFLLYNRKYS